MTQIGCKCLGRDKLASATGAARRLLPLLVIRQKTLSRAARPSQAIGQLFMASEFRSVSNRCKATTQDFLPLDVHDVSRLSFQPRVCMIGAPTKTKRRQCCANISTLQRDSTAGSAEVGLLAILGIEPRYQVALMHCIFACPYLLWSGELR